MQWVEVTGKSVAEAKDRALDRLGVDERDAEFEVLEEPRIGFLGRMKGEARVRARVKPATPRPKVERRDRRRGRRGDEKERPRDRREDGSVAVEDRGLPGGDDVGRGEAAGRSGATGGKRRRRRRSRGRSGRGAEAERERSVADDDRVDVQATASGEPAAEPREKVAAMAELSLDRQAEIVTEFLEGLLEAFALDGQVDAEIDDESVEVRVQGEQLGLLVGPRGQTLQAITELARSVLVRVGGGASARVQVDVAGYRQRRREALVRFTAEVAERVKASGEAVALEPMTAPDRKVVHDAINEMEGVSSTSEGEEPERRVVILPE